MEEGREGPLGGVLREARAKVYYHKIRLLVGSSYIDIRAGFSDALDLNILGQIGFLDHFIVTLDSTTDPPEFELQRIQKN